MVNEEHVFGFGLFTLFGVSFLWVFVYVWFFLYFTNALYRASPTCCACEYNSLTQSQSRSFQLLNFVSNVEPLRADGC